MKQENRNYKAGWTMFSEIVTVHHRRYGGKLVFSLCKITGGGFFSAFFFLRAPVLAFLRFPLIFAKFSEIQSELNWT
jgi:hypothetical protein